MSVCPLLWTARCEDSRINECVYVCVRARVCVRVCFGQLGVLPQELTQKLSWVQHMDEFGRGAQIHLMSQTFKFYTFTRRLRQNQSSSRCVPLNKTREWTKSKVRVHLLTYSRHVCLGSVWFLNWSVMLFLP